MILNVVQKYTHFIVTGNFHIEIIINESLCQDKLCFQYRVFVSVFFFCSVYMQNLVQPVFIYTFSHVLYMHVPSNRMYSNNKASLKVNYIICLTSQMNNLKLSVLIISLSFKSKHLQQQNLTNTNAKVLYRKTLKPIRN